MLKVLRTYRVVALLTAFALATSAFGPLSLLCGMEMDDAIPMMGDAASAPCHEMADSTLKISSRDELAPVDTSTPMLDTSCCTAKGLAAPTAQRVAPPVAQIVEALFEATLDVDLEIRRAIEAGESPPHRTPIALHILFGRFLT